MEGNEEERDTVQEGRRFVNKRRTEDDDFGEDGINKKEDKCTSGVRLCRMEDQVLKRRIVRPKGGRLATLLVQRIIAAPTVDFGKIEAQVIMNFLFLQDKGVAEIHGEMKDVLKDDCLSHSTVKMWVSRFWTGHFEVTGEPRSGQPTSATTEEKADTVHVMILKDCRISAKVIAETLGISHERVGHIIHNILDMRKLSTKWVPKCLNADQKRIRVTSKPVGMTDFMAHLVTMDETWLHYDPLTKQQSMEW
ncbi:uncharacterized protein LOC143029705 [Oratosquilla oratoria]|uniref:uncharacterized protein LOC143029705 n=1 Tax=Oratosquilla oratoria TaxID=337810 RepID=UPI003F77308F